MSVKLEIAEFLGLIDMFEDEVLDSDQVEKLERYIAECNSAMSDDPGVPIVEDAIYDRLVELLKKSNPDSHLLLEVWSKDDPSASENEDFNYYLETTPMASIQTVKSLDDREFEDFGTRLFKRVREVDLHYSMKLNGHGIRVVYENGHLVEATTRGRSTTGRNVTRHLKVMLGDLSYIEDIKDLGLVEFRGEVGLPLNSFEDAKKFNPDIKTPFTAVSSLIKESATEEEIKLLRFVTFKCLSDDLNFETKSSEYEFLSGLGFEVPLFFVQEGVVEEEFRPSVESMLVDFEDEVEEYNYFTDGLICEVDSRELFNSFGGLRGKVYDGNIALKVGFWQQNLYSGFVRDIEWTFGKSKYSPVALVSESLEEDSGVLTASGNSVRRVPLYEPRNILFLNAYVGSTIHFRYGGEAGVVPCTPDGNPLSESKVKELLEDDGYIE